jgi:hypothetical protein
MKSKSGSLALLLLVTVAVALPGVQAFALSAAQPGHPAGCPHHTPAQTPGPASYQCCVIGHHQAISSAPFSLRPLVVLFDFDAGEAPSPDSILSEHCSVSALPTNSPPGAAPLRI